MDDQNMGMSVDEAKATVNETLEKIARQIDRATEEARSVQAELEDLLLSVPNLPDEQVPIGTTEEENVEISRWGSARAPHAADPAPQPGRCRRALVHRDHARVLSEQPQQQMQKCSFHEAADAEISAQPDDENPRANDRHFAPPEREHPLPVFVPGEI